MTISSSPSHITENTTTTTIKKGSEKFSTDGVHITAQAFQSEHS